MNEEVQSDTKCMWIYNDPQKWHGKLESLLAMGVKRADLFPSHSKKLLRARPVRGHAPHQACAHVQTK